MNWGDDFYTGSILLRARYFDDLFHWPNGHWYQHFPHKPNEPMSGTVTNDVNQGLQAGYLRVVPDCRGYDRVVLTAAGHHALDSSTSVYALPVGFHMVPDERIYDQKRLSKPRRGAKLHGDFMVYYGGPSLSNAMYNGSEVYVGTVPDAVQAGDEIYVDSLGSFTPHIVTVTRTFDDAVGRHACIALHRKGPRGFLSGQIQHLPKFINRVGMWHLDLKPIDELKNTAMAARLGWTGSNWVFDVAHPYQQDTGNLAAEILDADTLAGYLTGVCRVPVTMHADNGRLVAEGPDGTHAYHIYWILRAAHGFNFHSRSSMFLDWMFDAPTATALGYPLPDHFLAMRQARIDADLAYRQAMWR